MNVRVLLLIAGIALVYFFVIRPAANIADKYTNNLTK